MKRLLVALLALSLAACAKQEESKPETTEAQKAAPKLEEWAEMEAFHGVMAETFHPMEDGDMKPILSRAQEMAEKAKAWQKSAPPARYAPVKDSVDFYLSKLVSESQSLAEMVAKKAKEDDIKKALTALHDRYHQVSDFCYSIDKELKKKMREEAKR
ncbi:MAG: hypothetical protein RMM16_00375 [Chloroherpetonaceae bacterium]|nr:hypothetical protein [Chloroherpetonaceae bacterium]